MAASGAGESESKVEQRDGFQVQQGVQPEAAYAADKKTLEQILEASRDGELAMLRVLLDGQSDKSKTSLKELCPRLRDGNKRTVLHFAAATDRADIVQYLVVECCSGLIDMKDSSGSTALLLAAAAGSALASKKLLELGADVHAARPSGEQAIHLAARNGRTDVLAILLEHGADGSSMGDHGTAIHEAAADNEAEALQMLLRAADQSAGQAGGSSSQSDEAAAVSFPPSAALATELNRPSLKGPTPLGMAAAMGAEKTAELLVRAGARLDTGAALGGLSALHLFADKGNTKGVKAILECPGGDAMPPQPSGSAAAAAAAEPVPSSSAGASSGAGHPQADSSFSQEDSVEWKAEERTRLACCRRNADGLIPLYLALASGHKDAAGLMLEASRPALPEEQRGMDLDELIKAYAEHGEKDKEARQLARAQKRAEKKRQDASSWNPRDPPKHPVPGSPDGDDYADLGPLPDAGGISESSKREAAEWKYRGDGAMKAKRFMEAVGFYKQALQRDPLNHAIYSNRSMALLKLNQAAMALEDARWCRRLAPWFVKGCYREGMARMAMMDFDRASQVFWTAYCMDNENYEMAELFKEAVAKGKAVAARERGESVSDSEDEDEAAAGGAGGDRELETAKIDE